MQLTKFTHACVRFDDGDRTLVIDPGGLSEFDAATDGADAVLITHEHFDHLDVDGLRGLAARNPRLQVFAPASVVGQLELGEQAAAVEPGQAFEAAGFGVRAFGGQHAVIHPTIPVIANIGYLIDERVYHPGDSLIVPTAPIQLLLAPTHAPWSKTSEVVDFVVAVRAPKAVNLHDSLLTDIGRQVVEGQIAEIGGQHGVAFQHLAPAETLDV